MPPTATATAPITARPSAGEHAAGILASRESRALELGTGLGALLSDPAELAASLASAFAELADPEYRTGRSFVAPGIGPTFGVRTPLDRKSTRLNSSH